MIVILKNCEKLVQITARFLPAMDIFSLASSSFSSLWRPCVIFPAAVFWSYVSLLTLVFALGSFKINENVETFFFYLTRTSSDITVEINLQATLIPYIFFVSNLLDILFPTVQTIPNLLCLLWR